MRRGREGARIRLLRWGLLGDRLDGERHSRLMLLLRVIEVRRVLGRCFRIGRGRGLMHPQRRVAAHEVSTVAGRRGSTSCGACLSGRAYGRRKA